MRPILQKEAAIANFSAETKEKGKKKIQNMFLHHLPFLSLAALAFISTVAFGATLPYDEGIC